MKFCPSTAEIRSIFQREIVEAGGKVTDVFDDGVRLFARSVLPEITDLRPGDRIRAGVALRAIDDQIFVHPYTFRLVCTNGAIVAQAVQTRQLERAIDGGPWETEEVGRQLCEAICQCARAEAFQSATRAMRTAMKIEADMTINMLPYLARLSPQVSGPILQNILQQFGAGRDRLAYGLMNAITATARDTRDPEVRWQLEALGAAVASQRSAPLRRRSSAAAIPVGA